MERVIAFSKVEIAQSALEGAGEKEFRLAEGGIGKDSRFEDLAGAGRLNGVLNIADTCVNHEQGLMGLESGSKERKLGRMSGEELVGKADRLCEREDGGRRIAEILTVGIAENVAELGVALDFIELKDGVTKSRVLI